MEIEWRTVQFFLNSGSLVDDAVPPVSEVSIDAMNSSKLRCDCPGFKKFGRCIHTRLVKQQLKRSNGVFNLTIPDDAMDDETAMEVMGDSDEFRELVLKYGRVEVV